MAHRNTHFTGTDLCHPLTKVNTHLARAASLYPGDVIDTIAFPNRPVRDVVLSTDGPVPACEGDEPLVIITVERHYDDGTEGRVFYYRAAAELVHVVNRYQ